ncbi:hypothetical protein ACF1UB_002715 [Vibrio fluvialis]
MIEERIKKDTSGASVLTFCDAGRGKRELARLVWLENSRLTGGFVVQTAGGLQTVTVYREFVAARKCGIELATDILNALKA